jgi:pimeloyl-ACP methyl ester carboxylesterase
MDSRTVEIDGIRMRWEEREGSGPPVVLLHGIPTSPALWRYVTPHIEGAHVLAWEMVGYGESIPEGEGRDISIARQAEYLTRWLESIGVDRAILVGHDLGGGVAQIAALRSPGLCAGLLLTNAIGYDSWPIPSVKALRAMGGLVRHLPDAALRMIFGSLLFRGHDDREMAKEALKIHGKPYARHGGTAALVRQIRALDVKDTLAVQDALPTLDVPARVVWGAADRFQKIRYGERFARDLRAPLRRIEGGKHFTPEDHPEAIAEAILELVAAVGGN